ncbi:MAG: peptide deformylase [Nitrospirae bacterium]|nr:MAG: peptide deformylase [Nitrospirota bacterium]
MAILPILHYPDPRLRRKCRPVERFDDRLRQLAADMGETMYEAPGVGLAAPQVGEAIRMLVYDPQPEPESRALRVVVNPEIVLAEGSVVGEEGCLSVPSFYGEVRRAERIVLRYQDLEGKVLEEEHEGLTARILQHEIDHLDGVVFLDRMSPLKRDILKRKIKKAVRAGDYTLTA